MMIAMRIKKIPVLVRSEGTYGNKAPRFVRGEGTHYNKASWRKEFKIALQHLRGELCELLFG